MTQREPMRQLGLDPSPAQEAYSLLKPGDSFGRDPTQAQEAAWARPNSCFSLLDLRSCFPHVAVTPTFRQHKPDLTRLSA